jgi:hypothetical protein
MIATRIEPVHRISSVVSNSAILHEGYAVLRIRGCFQDINALGIWCALNIVLINLGLCGLLFPITSFTSDSSMSAPTLEKPLQLPLSSEEVDRINQNLRSQNPQAILRWAVEHVPGLFQTTAFGLTGMVSIDMLSKITSNPPPLIFVDTLYHFPETYQLVEEVKRKYKVPVHIYKPKGCQDVQEFEAKYGQRLWEKDESAYDYYVKVCLFAGSAKLIELRCTTG